MSRTLTDILVARERLRARCEQQRNDVAVAVRGLGGPAAVLDRIADGGRYLLRHPLAVAGLVGAAFVLRGRSLLAFAARSIGLWRLAVKLRSFVQLLQR